MARRRSLYASASICRATRPRRPSFCRRSRRKARYFSPKYQRRSRMRRGTRLARSPSRLRASPPPEDPLDGSVGGVAVSFTAGLLSFLSPCVLPLVPSYVTFVTGMSLEDVPRSRRTALVHALLFVLGFSLIFLGLGASATLLGRVLIAYRLWLARAGGILVLTFGLYLLGAFNLGALARERRVHLTDKPLGYLGTVIVGVAFGAGWSPCIGPVLGSILMFAATQDQLSHGVSLLGAY